MCTPSHNIGSIIQHISDQHKLYSLRIKTNDNGTLHFEEFSKLHEVIGEWKTIFYQVDSDRSGTMEKDELSEALKLGGGRVFKYSYSVNLLLHFS